MIFVATRHGVFLFLKFVSFFLLSRNNTFLIVKLLFLQHFLPEISQTSLYTMTLTIVSFVSEICMKLKLEEQMWIMDKHFKSKQKGQE